MNTTRGQLLLTLICLLLGILLLVQFRNQTLVPTGTNASSPDQVTYISQLYESNTQLRRQVDELNTELLEYGSATEGKSNIASLARDLQTLRIASGEVAVTGPGVTVLVQGDLTMFQLQDLVNELRNASAEAVAVNGVRVVTRSAILADENGRLVVDRLPLSPPYRLEAIGAPATLAPALERKGGVIALIEAGDPDMQISVTRHTKEDRANWLKLPETALQFDWTFAKPLADDGR